MSSTLHDFTNVEPLKVREVKEIIANGRLVAWAGPSNRDENVVVSHRHRYQYDGGKQDYYRKHGSYNYDDESLTKMEEVGAERIAVLEVDNDRIIEYGIDQFRSSDLITSGFNEGGTNYAVPVENALYTWTTDEATIIRDH